VDLGTAGNFVILSKSGITSTGPTSITGDIAVSPITSTAITGFVLVRESSTSKFSTSTQVIGIVKAANYNAPTPAELTTAVSDMETAYTDSQSETNYPTTSTNFKGGKIGNQTLTAGVYTFTVKIDISTHLTFFGSATDIFIIRTSKNIVQATEINVTLTGGALAKNIFWSAALEVDVEARAHLEGIILSKTGVNLKTGSSLNGRMLAQTAVTLDAATITQPYLPSSIPSLEPSSIPSGEPTDGPID
ncbi:antifreeze protein, partial [Fragilariopsis cylindrus CCMP1102]